MEENVVDYLGCELKVNKTKKAAWIGQPHMVKKIRQAFGHLITKTKLTYKTPGTPGFNIVKPDKNDLITEKEHELYRSGCWKSFIPREAFKA